jgi:MFS transporter, FSR family, fosmidomycin resistance protein
MASEAPAVDITEEEGKFETNRILLISGGHFVHDTYSAFISPLLPILIDKLGLTLALAASLSVATQVPSLLSVLIGYLADRISVRYMVIFAPAVTATLATMIGFMPSYGAAVVLLMSLGISTMSFHAPAPAMIAHIAGNKVGRGMSFFMAGGELGRTVGPLLVGFGVTQWGIEGLWRLMIFGWLATAFLYFKLRDVSAKRSPKKAKPSPVLKQFLRLFAPLFGVMLFRNMIVSSISVFMVVFLVDIRGYELTWAVSALALYEFAGVGGALTGGTLSDRFGRRQMVAIALTLSACFMLIFVHVEGILLAPVLICLGFTSLSVTPIFQALVQDQLPNNRATASGMFILFAFIIRAINVMVAGLLGDLFGLQTTFIVLTLVSLLSLPIIMTLPASPKQKNTAEA